MKKNMIWAVVPLLIMGCGGSDDGGSGSKTVLPEYTNVQLESGTVLSDQTVQPGDGLTFKAEAAEADDVYIGFFDADGALAQNLVTIASSNGQACSFDEYGGTRINCTIENGQAGTVAFNFENDGNAPVDFSVVTWQGNPGEGTITDPVELTAGVGHEGFTVYGTRSYYSFTKTGDGPVRISLLEGETTLTGDPVYLTWNLRDDPETLIPLEFCSEDYSDRNVSCLRTIDAGEYYLEVLTY